MNKATTIGISLVIAIGAMMPAMATNPTSTPPLVKPAATVSKPAAVKPTPTTKASDTSQAVGSLDAALSAFKAAKLEIGSPITMTAKDYGKAPAVCAGISFLLPAQDHGTMGHVFYCPTLRDRDDLRTALGKQVAVSSTQLSRVYVKGNYVLQLDGKVSAADVRKYGVALPNYSANVVIPVATATTPQVTDGIPPTDASTCPANHPIKGNKSSKIYHVVADPSYKATKPEVCFATTTDAVAAGYRAPKK